TLSLSLKPGDLPPSKTSHFQTGFRLSKPRNNLRTLHKRVSLSSRCRHRRISELSTHILHPGRHRIKTITEHHRKLHRLHQGPTPCGRGSNSVGNQVLFSRVHGFSGRWVVLYDAQRVKRQAHLTGEQGGRHAQLLRMWLGGRGGELTDGWKFIRLRVTLKCQQAAHNGLPLVIPRERLDIGAKHPP